MVDLGLADVLRDNAERHADVVAYVDGERSITHGELHQRAVAVAVALARLGLRHQDRIAVLGRNSVAFGEVLAAGHLAGLVVATVNFRFAPAEIAAVVRDSAPRAVFCDAEFRPLIESVRSTVPTLEHVVTLDADPDWGPTVATLAADGLGAALPFTARPDDVACLIYTSGTTGRPKGCILGQRELRAGAFVMNAEMRTGSTDAVLLVMPMFHIGAMAIGAGLHARGGSVVLHRQFDPAALLAATRTGRVDTLHLAPVLLSEVLRHPGRTPDDLLGVRTVVYSAAPMTMPILTAALTAMPDAGFLNLYGQTEVFTSGLAREYHRDLPTPEHQARLATVGHPFPGNEVRVVDDDGRPVAPGGVGEIAVRSPTAFRGYWNDSAATAATLRDGWVHTGDVGRLNAEGLLTLVDRRKDVIISGGENVYSVEVEAALADHAGVGECVVVGVPDERWGEAVCAVIVPATQPPPALEALREHAAVGLARYKLPKRLIITAELPRLVSGKIDKKLVRQQAHAALTGPDE